MREHRYRGDHVRGRITVAGLVPDVCECALGEGLGVGAMSEYLGPRKFCGECGHRATVGGQCQQCRCGHHATLDVTQSMPYRITGPLSTPVHGDATHAHASPRLHPPVRTGVDPLSPWFLGLSVFVVAVVVAANTIGLAAWEWAIAWAAMFGLFIGWITADDRRIIREAKAKLSELGDDD